MTNPNHKLLSLLPLLLLAAVVGAAAPSPLDPVRVAPHIFELQYENDRVRVIQQTLRNGETHPLHAHPERLLVYLQTCGWLEDDANGNRQMQEFKYGEVAWASAITHGGEMPAVVQECKILEIEIL